MTYGSMFVFECDGCDAITPEQGMDSDLLRPIVPADWFRVETNHQPDVVTVLHFCPTCASRIVRIVLALQAGSPNA